MIWTDDQISELKLSWGRGYSATTIAAAMDLTRNAILGKVHRLKLPLRIPRSDRIASPRLSRAKVALAARAAARSAKEPRVKEEYNFRSPASDVLTKSQMRAMITEAVRNTAAMQ